jgi:dienelactone hydrolase
MNTEVSLPLVAPQRTLRQRLGRYVFLVLFSGGLLLALALGWRHVTRPLPTMSLVFAADIEGRQRQLVSEVFLPPTKSSGPMRRPAVILLHGIEGATRYRDSRYRTAHRLRAEGYAVFIVHYFGAVDYEDLWKFKPDYSLDHEAIERQRLADQTKWVGAVTSAIREIAQRDDIDPQRIAIDGYSLGGFIALSAVQDALEDPATPDVRCVVCNWGAMFRGEQFSPGYPPTLLAHGEQDNIVELKWARQTYDGLKKVGADVRLHVILDQEHMASSAESDRITQEFLAKHLQDN